MSFFFRMASRLRPSTPEEVVRSIKDSFQALHTKNGARVKIPLLLSSLLLCFSSSLLGPPLAAASDDQGRGSVRARSRISPLHHACSWR
ncbi:Os03g0359700 [Oryza sativa Japonica Group]|uniref:Os03g0359700 protein n=1 Tax=Oryza sativa subsp. japonica TaxID=39947 RepID=A0A0P0VXN6_ORYSJ|nr:hypothetical protein EE612_017524 [Oryza sativa]BAS84275.1 Os03g0359700 [Oryza sativa Japonica Group]